MGYRYWRPEEKKIELNIEYIEDPEISYKHKRIFLRCRYPIKPYFKEGEKGKGVIITFYSSSEGEDSIEIKIKEYLAYVNKGNYTQEEVTHIMSFDENGICTSYSKGEQPEIFTLENNPEKIEDAKKKLKEYEEVFEFIKRNVPEIDVLKRILEKF